MSKGLARRWLQEAVGDTEVDFRPGQWEAIDAVVNRRQSLLVVEKTGWGKSIVYFLSARLLRQQRPDALTIVVSPLISLMRNQIEQAQRIEVNAVSINASNTDNWEQHFEEINSGEAAVILMSPERMANHEFITERLRPVAHRVALLVVDEAHCISCWGHDFRPDYRRLPDVLAMLSPGTPVLCTTATATERVVTNITELFGGRWGIQRGPLNRRSLHLYAFQIPSKKGRLAWLAENVPKFGGSGVVYVLTKPDANQIADWLRSEGIAAKAYYAGILPSSNNDDPDLDPDEYRKELENALLGNEVKVLVATIALGMGFDKPDIRFVIHFQAPGSLLSYYQQVGRAGRAVDKAYGVLLQGDEDAQIHQHFAETAFPSQDYIEQVLRPLMDSHSGLTEEELEERRNIRPRHIAQALRHMAAEEINPPVEKIGGKWFATDSAAEYHLNEDHIDQVTQRRLEEWEEMQTFIQTDTCLMTKMRRLLDDTTLTCGEERCGKCKVCCCNPTLDPQFSESMAEKAEHYIMNSRKMFVCKQEAPTRFIFGRSGLPTQLSDDLLAEEGQVLSYWTDVGWGSVVQKGKGKGKFKQELVYAMADMIEKRLQPSRWKKNYGWVTCVPSNSESHGKLVPDFAFRLSKRLNLPFRRVVAKVMENEPQKGRKNNYHRCLNLDGAFKIKEDAQIFRGPVILVDDVVRSTWTMAVIAALLRKAGSGPVYPFGLALIGSED